MNSPAAEAAPVLEATALGNLPPPWPQQPLPPSSGAKVVVLDDDPTGTQTVHDVPVLADWSVAALRAELHNQLPAFYVLTNSRSLPAARAAARAAELGHHLRAAAQHTGRELVVVSRSDSTLRGHFPAETDALAAGLGLEFDATLLIPFFGEGGRLTIADTHYLRVGEQLVPVAQTEFARDAAFGYRNSNLRLWVEEKTAGRVSAADVASITIDDVRVGGPERVMQRALELPRGAVCIVNAAAQRDLEVAVAGLFGAEQLGRRFLYRTAASFVPLRAGIEPRPLLANGELALPPLGGGLIVAGSYVPTTSAQLAVLRQDSALHTIELDVAAILDHDRAAAAIQQAGSQVERSLAAGHDTLLMTSRELVGGADTDHSLAIGTRVSAALVRIVGRLATRPRYIIAKGGITSNDIATRALGFRRALVQGQLAPGIPVWRLGEESAYPGLAYIVFPGNVGEPHTLAQLVRQLRVRSAAKG